MSNVNRIIEKNNFLLRLLFYSFKTSKRILESFFLFLRNNTAHYLTYSLPKRDVVGWNSLEGGLFSTILGSPNPSGRLASLK